MSDELQQELRACLERNAQLQGACTSLELKLRSAQEEVKHLRQQLRQQVDEGSRKRDRDSMEAADAAGGKVADLARQLAVCNEEKRQLKRQLQEAERRLSGGDSHAVASQPQQQQQQPQQQQQQQQQPQPQQQVLAEAPAAGGAEVGGAGGSNAAAAVEPAAAGPAAGEPCRLIC